MPHHIRLASEVGAKMSMFDRRAKQHRQSQMENPFSQWHEGQSTGPRRISRNDPEYGRPVEGSKTAERGKLAQMQMLADMVQLCDCIFDCGIRHPDGRAAISFGELFNIYSKINDKCVGLLMRGRKHCVLDFEGEMLFQRRDDDKMIELLLPLNTIRYRFGMSERMGGGEVRHDLLQQSATGQQSSSTTTKQQRARSLEALNISGGQSVSAGAEAGLGVLAAVTRDPPKVDGVQPKMAGVRSLLSPQSGVSGTVPERAVSHPDLSGYLRIHLDPSFDDCGTPSSTEHHSSSELLSIEELDIPDPIKIGRCSPTVINEGSMPIDCPTEIQPSQPDVMDPTTHETAQQLFTIDEEDSTHTRHGSPMGLYEGSCENTPTVPSVCVTAGSHDGDPTSDGGEYTHPTSEVFSLTEEKFFDASSLAS